MPTYEYQCQKCGKIMEVFHGMSEEGPKKCSDAKCKGKVKRLIGAGTGLIFKGSGFYITDYKKKGAEPAAEKTASCASEAASGSCGCAAESKPAAKPAKAAKADKAKA